jgi:hypothetical protein
MLVRTRANVTQAGIGAMSMYVFGIVTAKDHLAEIGMTEDDLRELIQKLEACPQ